VLPLPSIQIHIEAFGFGHSVDADNYGYYSFADVLILGTVWVMASMNGF
jgi:hypothetical protein